MSYMLKKVTLKIHGMRCASCEVFLERKFKEVFGVEKVCVSYRNGKAKLYCQEGLDVCKLNNMVRSDGYQVSLWDDHSFMALPEVYKNTKKDYVQIGGIFLVIVSGYVILEQFNFVPSFTISEQMSYGLVFLIGLFAAVSSCIAVVGGLLLSISAKLNALNPERSGFKKFKPHIYFNIGRIVGYTVFGAAVGGLGSVFILSPQINGYLMIVVSFVMLLLGFQLLRLFPWLNVLSPRMPKFISHKVHDLSAGEHKSTPFVLGSLTFFLPCGFTQALQLYVLATGDWKVGALTMLVFSLGTLPVLLSLGAVSSFVKNVLERHVLRFAGVLVIMIAVFNLNNGLTLTGSYSTFASMVRPGSLSADTALTAPVLGGKQTIAMSVNGYDYTPSKFTVAQGVPVVWQIDGQSAASCGKVLVVPTLGVRRYLSEGITTITFTPDKLGEISFNCSMGMMTSGAAFMVVPNILRGN